MCWLKKINRKFDKLPTKMLKAMREEAASRIRVCRTGKTWPDYGVYRMIWNGEYYCPGDMLEKVTEEQVKNGEASKILKDFQRDYIINTLIKKTKIQYEQYGITV